MRGVASTHYTFDLDLKKNAEQSGPSTALAKQYRQQLGRDTLPVELWADGQDRVARLRTSVPLPTASGPAPSATPSGQAATVTMELFDFGTPVSVTAPPAEQVRELPILRPSATPTAAA